MAQGCSLAFTNGKIVAVACGEQVEATPLAGTFPNIDAVLPKGKGYEGNPTITLNVSLLLKLAEALHFDYAKRDPIVSLWIKDDRSTILVKAGEPGAVGVIMPVRPEKALR